MQRKRPLAISWLAVAFLSVVSLGPTSARAAAICNFFDSTAHVDGGAGTMVIDRAGDDITVDGATCGDVIYGTASITNTAVIHVDDNYSNSQGLEISLANGPFAPGLDAGPTPEIDFEYVNHLTACDRVLILGASTADRIQWGRSLDGVVVANLNADEADGIDADFSVAMGCISPTVRGGDGDDVIDGSGGAGTENPAGYFLHLIGGPGRDTLTVYRYGELDGGPGADLVTGGKADNRLTGGGGKDKIFGGGGDDVINGGGGYDVCVGGGGTDRFNECEKVTQ